MAATPCGQPLEWPLHFTSVSPQPQQRGRVMAWGCVGVGVGVGVERGGGGGGRRFGMLGFKLVFLYSDTWGGNDIHLV